MTYIYGISNHERMLRENLKTVGNEHSKLSGYISTVQEFSDGTKITDRCRIIKKYASKEANGLCYDWYVIDSHYRETDISGKTRESIDCISENVNRMNGLNAQISVAARMYVQAATNIPDETALEMPSLFKTWEEALAAGEMLAQNSIINDGGTLYRVVTAVTPQEHQPPHSEGMLAVYRPIDQTHTGTQDDPVPWVYGMDCTEGTYYSYGGAVYLCKADMKPCTWAPDTAGLWQWEKVV